MVPTFNFRQSRLAILSGLTAALFAAAAEAAESSWRLTPDLIVKRQWLSESDPSPGDWYSFGIDAYKNFSLNGKNFAALTVQVYGWHVQNRIRKPGVLEGLEDSRLISKVSTINFNLSGDGKFNFLVGHPELPYGLEVPVSTNETLRTLLTPRDTGLKLDWGLGANGTINGLSYATTLTRGSGFEWDSKAKDGKAPWALAGRIGTATDQQGFLPAEGIGLSFFLGNTLQADQTRVERWRIAGDVVHYYGPVGILAQLSYGQTDKRDTINAYAELNRSTASETCVAYLQFKSYNEAYPSGWEHALSVSAGIRYAVALHSTFSLQISRDVSGFFATPEQSIIDAQMRFRFD